MMSDVGIYNKVGILTLQPFGVADVYVYVPCGLCIVYLLYLLGALILFPNSSKSRTFPLFCGYYTP